MCVCVIKGGGWVLLLLMVLFLHAVVMMTLIFSGSVCVRLCVDGWGKGGREAACVCVCVCVASWSTTPDHQQATVYIYTQGTHNQIA